MEKRIIMISGRQGSGKTTTGEAVKKLLTDVHGYTCIDLTFASTIYEIHDKAIEILESKGVKRNLVKDGPLLQLLGTEWGRNTIDRDIWVKCLNGEMNTLAERAEVAGVRKLAFLITDCRFKNEFNGLPWALRVRLECSEEIRKPRCSMWRENSTHPSEIDLDQYVYEDKFDMILDSGECGVDEIAINIVMKAVENKYIKARDKGGF